MTLPNSLGFGGTGWHGEDAVPTRTTLSSLVTLANEIRTDHNALLTKLDGDTGVPSTNYAAQRAIAAAAVSSIPASLGEGGTRVHGDEAVALRVILQAIRTLVNEAKVDHNALRVKLADDSLGDTDYDQVTATDEVQIITITGDTGGTYTLTYSGQTTEAIDPTATAAEVQAALEQLSNIEVGDIAVTGSAGGPYTVTFGGLLADENVAAITSTVTELDGTNEIQTVTVNATGGTFTITYSGQTTAAIAFNAAASAVTSALEALSNIAPGDVVVTGGPGAAGGGTPYTLTFGGTLANQNVAAVTTGAGSLTGGAGTATVATPTPGVAPTVVITTDTPGVSPLTVVSDDVAVISDEAFTAGAGAHGEAGRNVKDAITASIALANELKAKHNALLAKLDADGTVNLTNYVADRTIAADDVA